MENSYIDTSVQKGGIPGVSGCLSHHSRVFQLIREVRKGKGNLTILWLELANVYGFIPHNFVELVLQRHHVPTKITLFWITIMNSG